MIRLSCWIGGVGCALVDNELAEDRNQSMSPVMQTSPVKRCIDADIEVSGGFDLRRFENAASRLARHFRVVDAGEKGESSVDEILETWRKYSNKLLARGMPDCPDIPENASTNAKEKAPCLTDAH